MLVCIDEEKKRVGILRKVIDDDKKIVEVEFYPLGNGTEWE